MREGRKPEYPEKNLATSLRKRVMTVQELCHTDNEDDIDLLGQYHFRWDYEDNNGKHY